MCESVVYLQYQTITNYYIMSTAIQDIKTGDYFKRKEGAKKTFERGAYCRTNKAYECTNVEDISDFIYIKKNKQVILTDY